MLPNRTASRPPDFFNANGGDGGEDLQGFARSARAGGGEFAFGMEGFLATAGAEEYRSCPYDAKQISGGINVGTSTRRRGRSWMRE